MEFPSINRLEEISRKCTTLDRAIDKDVELLDSLAAQREEPQSINEMNVQLREHSKQRRQLEQEFKEAFLSAEEEVFTNGRKVLNDEAYSLFSNIYHNYKEKFKLLKAIKWAKDYLISSGFEHV